MEFLTSRNTNTSRTSNGLISKEYNSNMPNKNSWNFLTDIAVSHFSLEYQKKIYFFTIDSPNIGFIHTDIDIQEGCGEETIKKDHKSWKSRAPRVDWLKISWSTDSAPRVS